MAKSGNGYELNFSDAPLQELAKVVLGDTLGVPYTFDTAVQGRVTISTGGPVSRNELLSIFEAVIAVNRGALISDGKLYRIVVDDGRAQDSGIGFDYVRELQEVGPGYGLSVMPLKYVSPDTMLRMLGSFSGKQGMVRAGIHNNLLFIRGTGRERQSLLEVVTMFDVDWMKGQSAGLYTLRNISPGDIIPELQQVFQAEGQGAGLLRFQPIERMNAVLVLTQKSAMLDQVETWIRRLDRTGPEGDNYHVYRVEHGKAKDLAEVLNATFNGSGGIVRGAEEVSPGQAASRLASSSSLNGANGGGSILDQRGSADVKNGAAEPSLTKPSGGEDSVSSSGGGGSGDVRIIPDERNNTLLIRASGRDYRKILKVLSRMDQPPLQVLINATLAEVTLNDNLKYGVQFHLQKNNGKKGSLGFTNGSQIEISPSAPGLNFVVGSLVDSPTVVLDALAAETSVRVVSSPSVVVLHNQAATLQVGDEVPIATRQASSVTDPDAPLVNEIEFRNTGVILKVTPRINSNGLVTMDIEQEISAVSSSAATGELTPTISQRRISSMIAVQSGQMVVLGGLISEQSDNEKSRVPILGKLPYLGDVVGSTDKGKSRTELIVFLRPTIIRDAQDASRVAEEMRARMQSMAPRPAAWDVKVENSRKYTPSKP
jgi:general secretion pathway protein D